MTPYDPTRPITADNWPPGLRMPPLRRKADGERLMPAQQKAEPKAEPKAVELAPELVKPPTDRCDELLASLLQGPPPLPSPGSFFD